MSEITEQIKAKIETKTVSLEKTSTKADNIVTQIDVYEKSLANLAVKMETLRSQIEKFKSSRENHIEEVDARKAEVEHMTEILERVINGESEREALSVRMREMIAADTWMPGDPEEERGKLQRDPEFIRIRDRKLFLDDMIEAALGDVNRIFYSRGEVSGYHQKGEPVAKP